MKIDSWFFLNEQTGAEILQPEFYTPRSQLGLYTEADSIDFPLNISFSAFKADKILFQKETVIQKENESSDLYNFICRANSFLFEYWTDDVTECPDILEVTVKTAGQQCSQTVQCNYAEISGRVTDFAGNPFPSCVCLCRYGFNFPHRIGVWTDGQGNYSVKVPEGLYNAIFVDDSSYRKSTLENWSWHMIVDGDERHDFKVGTGEVYSLSPWVSNGGLPVMMLYFRPMILKPEEKYNIRIDDRQCTVVDVSPVLEAKDISVLINGRKMAVYSLQRIYETDGETAFPAYIVQTEKPDCAHGKQTVTVEYNTVSEGVKAQSQGRCQFYFKDNFKTVIK